MVVHPLLLYKFMGPLFLSCNMASHYGLCACHMEIAEQTGDHEAVRRLQQELEELDSRADRADKKRCADISAINWINQRNRNKMKEQFLSDKVVSGTKSILTTNEAGSSSESISILNRAFLIGTYIAAPTSSATFSKTKPSSSYTPTSGPSPQFSKSASNLFDLHGSIKKVDLDIDLGKLTRPTTSRVDELLHLPSPRPTAPPSNSGTRPLSLEDYRRRKAAAAQAP
uniref:BRCA1-associated protein n=1 Tax=Angiostrongylus cantonensis TaxID=6313 RepID=A0A0K0CTX8_ANGCA